jgi:hypothetical protein
MTKKDVGTNPPIVTTYISGLRGQPAPAAQAVSKYVGRGIRAAVGGGGSGSGSGGGSDAKQEDATNAKMHEQYRARVVTLKLDL